MKAQLFVTVLLVAFLGIHGNPGSNNEKDVQTLLNEKEQIVSDELDEFKEAAKTLSKHKTLRELYTTLVDTVTQGHDINDEMLDKTQELIEKLKKLTKKWLSTGVKLDEDSEKLLTWLIDEYSGKVSYYKFYAAQEWIENDWRDLSHMKRSLTL
jgi:hypothetical protein